MEPRQQPVPVLSGLLLAPAIDLRQPSHIAGERRPMVTNLSVAGPNGRFQPLP